MTPHFQLPFLCDVVRIIVGQRRWALGSLCNADGNENGKKAIGLDKQNNNFARVSRFFVHFSAVVARLQRESA